MQIFRWIEPRMRTSKAPPSDRLTSTSGSIGSSREASGCSTIHQHGGRSFGNHLHSRHV